MNAEQLDALVNAYLFDIGLFKDTQEEEQIKLLCQQHKKISSSLQLLKALDLEQLGKKYQDQIEEMSDEIEWRKNRGKMRDTALEESESALGGILDQIRIQLKDTEKTKYIPREMQKKKADKVLQNSQYQTPEVCEDVEFNDDFREFEDYEEIEPGFEVATCDLPPENRALDICERVKNLTSKIDKISAESTRHDRPVAKKKAIGSSKAIKKSPLAKNNSAKKSTSPLGRTRKNFVDKANPLGKIGETVAITNPLDKIGEDDAKKRSMGAKKSSKRSKSPGKTKTLARSKKTSFIPKKSSTSTKKPVSVDEIEQTRRMPTPPETNQEDRISTMINKFLNKRPGISWQERDRQEKEKKQKLFKKEIQLKKEREQFRQKKAQKNKKKKWWS